MKKILLSSDCNGRIEFLFTKVNQLHEKNKFDFMIMTGNICTVSSSCFINKMINKQFALALPVYFIDDSQMALVFHKLHPKGTELAPNLFFLGKYGIKFIQGFQIGYYGGSGRRKNISLNDEDINTFLQQCKSKNIDILLTNEWSPEIKALSQKTNAQSSNFVSRIVNVINPKYHIAAGSDSFFRLSPYQNSKNSSTHFISIAPILNEQPKDKYLYGITIKPQNNEIQPNLLENPYKDVNSIEGRQGQYNETNKYVIKEKSRNKEVKIDENTYIYFEGFPDYAKDADISEFLQRWGQIKKIQIYKKNKGNSRTGIVRFNTLDNTKNCLADSTKFTLYHQRIKFYPRNIQDKYRHGDCWFCINKQNFDSSLVIFRGTYCYISLQKGPISQFHIQIIPYNHVQSSGRLQKLELEQIQTIKSRFISYFNSKNQTVLGYQRYLTLSEDINHCILHLIPVEQGENVLNKFKLLNSEDNLRFVPWNDNMNRKNEHFIQLQINDAKFLRQIYRKEKVQTDFMRQVICLLLKKPQLVSWKNCLRNADQLQNEKNDIALILNQMGLLH